MPARHESIRRPLIARVRAPAWWGYVVCVMPRLPLAFLLAVLLPVLVLVAGLSSPAALRSATSPATTDLVFSSFIPAVVAAASLAVAFATLALRRGLEGIGGLQAHMREDDEYRATVRRSTRRSSLSLGVGPFLADLLADVASAAAQARGGAQEALALETDGTSLRDYLDAVEDASRHLAERMRAARGEPDRILLAALDVELETSRQLARRFARDERIASDARDTLARLEELLAHVAVARSYAKTLVTQWGFGRMATTVALSSLSAIVTCTLWVLLYDDAMLRGLGERVALALVAGGLFLVVIPLTSFVSYSLRFVFLNESTLPLGDFLLGPEREDEARAASGSPPRLGGRPREGA